MCIEPVHELSGHIRDEERHHEPKALFMAGASFLSVSAAPRTRPLSRERHDGGVPRVCIGVYTVLLPAFTGVNGQNRPFTSVTAPFYVCFSTVLAPVLRRFAPFYVKLMEIGAEVIKLAEK